MTRVQRIVQGREILASGEGRRIREQARVSQREAAAAIGVDHTTLRDWELGRSMPRADAAVKYLRFIDSMRVLVA